MLIIGSLLLVPDLMFFFLGFVQSFTSAFIHKMFMENLIFPGPVLVIINRNKISGVVNIG